MSKAIDTVANVGTFGLYGAVKNGTKAKYNNKPGVEYANYLSQYDTSVADETLKNLSDYARQNSNNLGNMGDYTFSVDGSDEARQRAEDATYQAYVDRLTPQFERQVNDYATMLQNQGIPVGSEAYNRAMGDLEQKQNDALAQAAYASVLNGQNSYSQSLNDQISAGNFGNTAQASYIAQILAALGEAPSEFDVQGDIYAVRSNNAANQYNAKQQTTANRLNLLNGILGAGAKVVGGMSGGAA